MWRMMKVTIAFTAATGTCYAYQNEISRGIFNIRTYNYESFLVYNKNEKQDLTPELSSLDIPIFHTSTLFDPEKIGMSLDKSHTGLNFVRKINGVIYNSPLDSKERLTKWLKFHKSPYKTINSREELLNLLKNRKKTGYLDSLILVYAPQNDATREVYLNQAIIQLYYKESPSKYLANSTSGYLHLVRITDPELAKELKIDSENLTYLKIADPRGALSTKKLRSSYQNPEILNNYYHEKLQQNFTINGHEYQLDNQIFFDRFELSLENNHAEGKFSSIDELFDNIGAINPLILPVFNPKQLILTGSKVFLFGQQENSKILLVSLKNNKTDKSLNGIPHLMALLNLEKFAFNNPNILTIIGSPEYIYHLPLKDLAVYHFEDLEIRLLTVYKGTVVDCQSLEEGMTFDDLLKSEEPRIESSPVKHKQNAINLDVEKFNEKIFKNLDRCAFVMNCSKTCPACVYAEHHFQEAALMSQKCSFYKYYVSNQNPVYKGPNSTPRFHLYKPQQTTPIVYEQRVHGIGAKNFLDFIDKQIG